MDEYTAGGGYTPEKYETFLYLSYHSSAYLKYYYAVFRREEKKTKITEKNINLKLHMHILKN
ncbi:hypothetical protein BpHYR1_011634 [Brachionus plicatilis]|uniref:Uncharacterized protein n=1 Tax=Brachionus plicatilis TaxID=10195 RepID=A0A3M7SRR6_BRAPC|nr:hypothetical protein BpHYR1_011634 [Brachionus plicatilis]